MRYILLLLLPYVDYDAHLRHRPQGRRRRSQRRPGESARLRVSHIIISRRRTVKPRYFENCNLLNEIFLFWLLPPTVYISGISVDTIGISNVTIRLYIIIYIVGWWTADLSDLCTLTLSHRQVTYIIYFRRDMVSARS